MRLGLWFLLVPTGGQTFMIEIRMKLILLLVRDLITPFSRMGSFTAIPKAKGEANPDEDLDFPETSIPQLLARCRTELSGLPPPFQRSFRPNSSVGKAPKSRPSLRVLQWNQLSQTLGSQNDGFVRCPLAALEWRTRRWRLLEELVRHQPDILCLQEVGF